MDLRIIAVLFISGIYFGDKIGFTNMLFILIGIGVVCTARFCAGKRTALMIPIAVISFAMGIMTYRLEVSDEFNKSFDYMNESVTILGTICDIPYENGGIMKYTVKSEHIKSDMQHELREKFIIYSEEVFKYGDTVAFTGILRPLPRKMNENGFDTANYYRFRGISGCMTADKTLIIEDFIQHKSLYNIVNSIRYSICKLIDKYYTGDRAGVLKAVIIGNKYEFSDEMNNILTRTSLRRFFYPAYIHIMILSMIIGCISTVVNRNKRDIITAVILILYMLVNINFPSFVRGFSCTAASVLSRRFFKRGYYPDVLSAAVLVNSISNPLIVFDAGYVLSLISAVLVKVFYKPLTGKYHALGTGWIIRTIIVGLICTVGTIPLSAYYFNTISVYSIIASVIFFPVVVSILIVSPLFLGMIHFFGTAPIAGHFMTTMTSIMIAVPKAVDKLPFSRIYIKAPSLTFIAAYFLLIASAAYIIKKKKIRANQFACAAAVLFVICSVRSVMRINTVEVDFVNVGQGDGAVVTVPFGANLLIDGGGSGEYSNYDIGTRIYLPYLVDKGITTVDAAFVSHYHKDHAQGIAAALDNIRVKNIFMPDSMPGSEWRMKLVEKAVYKGTKIWFVKDNMKITFNNGLTVDITVPDTETNLSKDENDTSLLINVSYGEFNCLFTGDMTKTAEKNYVRKGKVPKAEVLKVAHHGSKKSTCGEFFEAVSPVYSVISLGEDNVYGFPHNELMQRLKKTEVLRTDIRGDIRIISDKKGNIKVHTFR